jgi:hypothetical protein
VVPNNWGFNQKMQGREHSRVKFKKKLRKEKFKKKRKKELNAQSPCGWLVNHGLESSLENHKVTQCLGNPKTQGGRHEGARHFFTCRNKMFPSFTTYSLSLSYFCISF